MLFDRRDSRIIEDETRLKLKKKTITSFWHTSGIHLCVFYSYFLFSKIAKLSFFLKSNSMLQENYTNEKKTFIKIIFTLLIKTTK